MADLFNATIEMARQEASRVPALKAKKMLYDKHINVLEALITPRPDTLNATGPALLLETHSKWLLSDESLRQVDLPRTHYW